MAEETKEGRVTVRELARRTGITAEAGERFVEEIMRSLEVGHEVHLGGFGIFRVTSIAPRELRTPMIPGGVANIPARRVVRYRQLTGIELLLNPGQKRKRGQS